MLALLCALLAAPRAYAVSELPYHGYLYDAKGVTHTAPSGYWCERVVFLEDLGATRLSRPRDLQTYDGCLYILDTGNRRVVVMNAALEIERVIDAFVLDGQPTALNEPQGLYIRDERMYIADTENARVLICDMNGIVLHVIARPDTPVIAQTTAFRPTKAIMDSSGFLYVLSEGIYQGLICFDIQGRFSGFHGSNKVTISLRSALKYALRKLFSTEQLQSMERYIPVEITNFTIDESDFLYTVTMGTTDAWQLSRQNIQRLNPLGANVLRYNLHDNVASGGAIYPKDAYGDITFALAGVQPIRTRFIDVHIDDNGVFSGLDRQRGRVFQYDQESNLLFIFGGIGNQKGTFAIPSAIEMYDGRYVVLDEQKENLTFFAPTEYAQLVLQATHLYNEGLYAQSKPLWERILVLYSGNETAYKALGKTALEEKRYGEAMDYFRLGNDRATYSLALQEYRKQFIQQNIAWLLAGVIAAVLLLRFLTRALLKALHIERKRHRIRFQ